MGIFNKKSLTLKKLEVEINHLRQRINTMAGEAWVDRLILDQIKNHLVNGNLYRDIEQEMNDFDMSLKKSAQVKKTPPRKDMWTSYPHPKNTTHKQHGKSSIDNFRW